MNNLKQLMLAWKFYADDNNGMLVAAGTWRPQPVASAELVHGRADFHRRPGELEHHE